ncbi:hypothetical protein R6Q59_031437 [Mikania micrantha]
MTDMLHITCQDSVILHGYNGPKVPPPQIVSKVRIPMTFNLIVNLDRSIMINKATEAHESSSSTTLTSLPALIEKVNLTPSTPNPKPPATKKRIKRTTSCSCQEAEELKRQRSENINFVLNLKLNEASFTIYAGVYASMFLRVAHRGGNCGALISTSFFVLCLLLSCLRSSFGGNVSSFVWHNPFGSYFLSDA